MAERPVPVLVMMSGLPATGKSSVARLVAARLGAELVETDAVRRGLLPRRDYSPDERSRVYAACYDLLDRALAAGRDAVFDATNLTDAHRAPVYALAVRHGARLTVARTVLDPAEVRRRLERRRAGADPDDRSEAGWPAYLALRARAEPIDRDHLVLDTAAADAASLADRVVAAAREAAPSKPALTTG